MRITQIHNGLYNRNFSFQRKLRNDEKADFQKDMEDGFSAAGVKQRIAITHGSVFPATDRDSFIGSPYGEGARKWTEFLMLNGFNGNQLGPNGGLSDNNISPYNTSALNENQLFLDLKALTTEKYGKILSQETYHDITMPIVHDDKNYAFTDFEEAANSYITAVREIYRNYKKNLAKGQPEAIKLNKEFTQFLKYKGTQTEEEAIFKLLAGFNGTQDSDKWENKLDGDLMSLLRKQDPKAIKRYTAIKRIFRENIREYQFEQFILNKQIKENKEFRKELNFKYFSDFLVGCSDMDKWRYKEAFLKGYAIGAYEHGDTPYQTWGIPVLNPRMLFKDDELNIGGLFLKEKIEHALENCENTRIDHALGLIDPFIYEESSIHKDENGRQIKNLVHGDFMSQIRDAEGNKLDDYYSYPKILRKIILPALKRKNLENSDPVWENICCEPEMFKKIYYEDSNLPRLVQLEYSKGEFEKNHHWYLVGSHDSVPAMNMLKADGGWRRTNPAWEATYLAGYLHQDRLDENIEFCKNIADAVDGIEKTGKELEKADRARVIAKFAELFTKEKIQVSFADILGINDKNVVYNIGGSDNQINWRERISPDFIDKYYKNLSSDNPTALNIPEVLGIAVRAKIDMEIVNSQNPDEARTKLHEQFDPLLKRLDHWAEVLKEKE